MSQVISNMLGLNIKAAWDENIYGPESHSIGLAVITGRRNFTPFFKLSNGKVSTA
jgi:hypothetical protein